MSRWILLTLLLAACGGVAVDDSGVGTDDTVLPPDDTEDTASQGSGLERYCARYKECGGVFHDTAEDCVQASLDYWGECLTRRDALDAFGDCMEHVPCEDYDPDSYDPATTVCADEWSALVESDPC